MRSNSTPILSWDRQRLGSVLKVKGGDIALNGKLISELHSVTWRMGLHSVTCHPTQVNAPHLNPSQIGCYLIHLLHRDGTRYRFSTLRVVLHSSVWTAAYLGVMFNLACHLDVDVDVMIRKFYTASNSILSHAKHMSELSKLYLVESFCLPVLSYSCEAVSYSRNQLHPLNVCWNNTYRKIFGLNKWESVKLLIGCCERVDFIHICAQRKLTFVQHLARLSNDVLSTCVSRFKLSKEFTCLCSDFEVLPTDNLSKGKLRSIVFQEVLCHVQ